MRLTCGVALVFNTGVFGVGFLAVTLFAVVVFDLRKICRADILPYGLFTYGIFDRTEFSMFQASQNNSIEVLLHPATVGHQCALKLMEVHRLLAK